MKRFLAMLVFALLAVSAQAQTTIRVLLVWSPGVVAETDALGYAPTYVKALANYVVTDLNAAITFSGYTSSNMNAVVAGEVVVPTTYRAEHTAMDAAIENLTIKAARDAANADIVLIVASSYGTGLCGVAGGVQPGPYRGMVLVRWDCMENGDSGVHEIGHLLGFRHQAAADSASTPYATGHGYAYSLVVSGSNYCGQDVMYSGVPASGCFSPKLLFSNPSVYDTYATSGSVINYAPMGNAAAPHYANIAAWLPAAFLTVSQWRTTKLIPPQPPAPATPIQQIIYTLQLLFN